LYTIPKQNPVVYPRKIEIDRSAIELVNSFPVGNFGELVSGIITFSVFSEITKVFKKTDKIVVKQNRIHV
jgi:hypothetical protein